MAKYRLPKAPATSGFGAHEAFRSHPHRGQDWGYRENAVIPFPCAAVVYDVFWSDVLGWTVEFVDDEKTHVQVSHLAKKPSSYKPGDVVKLGQPLGRCGGGKKTPSGSASTGAHAHFAMSKKKHPHKAAFSDLIDPLEYMKERN